MRPHRGCVVYGKRCSCAVVSSNYKLGRFRFEPCSVRMGGHDHNKYISMTAETVNVSETDKIEHLFVHILNARVTICKYSFFGFFI